MQNVNPMGAVPGLPPALANRERDFFAYSVSSLPLAAGGVANPTFSVQGDSGFLAYALTGTARDPNAPTVVFANPAVTVLVKDSGSGRDAFNAPQDWNSIIGVGQRPLWLPYPKYYPPASVVTVDLANLDAAQAYNVRITVLGFKVF